MILLKKHLLLCQPQSGLMLVGCMAALPRDVQTLPRVQTRPASDSERALIHTSAVELGDDSEDAVDKAIYDVGGLAGVFWAVSLSFEIQSPAVVMMQQVVCLSAGQISIRTVCTSWLCTYCRGRT